MIGLWIIRNWETVLKCKTFVENKSAISEQYNDFKYAMCEKIKLEQTKDFAELVIFSLHNRQFNEFSRLLDIGDTFFVSVLV